jgi:hypothetical protein
MKTDHARVAAGGVAVIGHLSKATMARLAAHGQFTKVSDDPPIHAMETTRKDLRALSEEINAVVGTEAVVSPLLSDNDGSRLVPTGQMQVRFKEPPSAEALDKFAQEHKVELAGLNKWAPAQAAFSVRSDDTRYLPELESELQDDKTVKAAWADVKAAFRRDSA